MNPLVIGIIIVVGFLTAVILVAIYNSSPESTQPTQESELSTQKTWVAIAPRQCDESYKNHTVTISDSRIGRGPSNVVSCAACYMCGHNYVLYLLVSNSDVDKMLELGYKISSEEALTRIGQKVNWTFIPADPFSCDGVDCGIIHRDEKCAGGRSGYLVAETGSTISIKERGILESDADIDYSKCK